MFDFVSYPRSNKLEQSKHENSSIEHNAIRLADKAVSRTVKNFNNACKEVCFYI